MHTFSLRVISPIKHIIISILYFSLAGIIEATIHIDQNGFITSVHGGTIWLFQNETFAGKYDGIPLLSYCISREDVKTVLASWLQGTSCRFITCSKHKRSNKKYPCAFKESILFKTVLAKKKSLDLNGNPAAKSKYPLVEPRAHHF